MKMVKTGKEMGLESEIVEGSCRELQAEGTKNSSVKETEWDVLKVGHERE